MTIRKLPTSGLLKNECIIEFMYQKTGNHQTDEIFRSFDSFHFDNYLEGLITCCHLRICF